MRKIYIFLTKSDTWVSHLISLVTNDTYTHASISFEPNLQPMYSFSRKFVSLPLPAGLRAEPLKNSPVHRMTLTFSVEELRARAKAEHTTLTAYFTTRFAQTAMQLQRQEMTPGRRWQPVQIMVPIDLRKRFPSLSCRNFSLYALPKLTLDAANGSFSEIAGSMAAQIRAQLQKNG